MSKLYRFNIVDVFTETPFAGNQLAVFTNAVGLSDERMQEIAREMGFSETTFVLPPEQGGDLCLRIFTPVRELPFAGHPVLGTAFALAGPLQSTLVRIETGSGIVPVLLEREGAKIVFGSMQQPIPTWEAFDAADELLAALGVTGTELQIEVYDNGIKHVFVALSTADEVSALQPDMARLAAVAGVVGVNVFSTTDYHVTTRMFFTDVAIGEDAATGSAAGPLVVHLSRHGRIGWGSEIVISQGASIGRPSTLYATVEGDADEITSVAVGGCAVVVAKGEMDA
ncbi:MAG: PhzF family phenazine biosynthesis protein [Actinomycetota bacterium]|jgi:trans-2,3-dihydro-3-hydroxyanthranilate isomerase|nr:PhzF family phenazine biosynthesis protein [Actinomycetota bacterium]